MTPNFTLRDRIGATGILHYRDHATGQCVIGVTDDFGNVVECSLGAALDFFIGAFNDF